MKTILTIAAIAAFQMASAQKTVELKDLKNISVGADTKVTLIKSSQNKLVIKGGDDDNDLDIQTHNGNLSLNGGEDLDITLYFKDGLESISAASDAQIVGTDEINAKELSINASSDSKIELKLNVNRLRTDASSDASVTLTGKAMQHDITLSSDAEFKGEQLLTENTNINVSSDAAAVITAKGIVNADVSSDGSLKIYGKPKKVNETKDEDAEITVMR